MMASSLVGSLETKCSRSQAICACSRILARASGGRPGQAAITPEPNRRTRHSSSAGYLNDLSSTNAMRHRLLFNGFKLDRAKRELRRAVMTCGSKTQPTQKLRLEDG